MGSDEEYLKQLANEYIKEYYSNIESDLKQIWYEIVDKLVYSRQPEIYDRTYQLRDRFRVDIKGNEIFAYVDSENMEYHNSKGEVSGEYIAHWVDVGHNQGNSPFGDIDYFHQYPARYIIEEYYEEVKTKYPEFGVVIVKDTLPII